MDPQVAKCTRKNHRRYIVHTVNINTHMVSCVEEKNQSAISCIRSHLIQQGIYHCILVQENY